jgi:sulfur relay (sulfurtransferase) DsrC/TusE family protein
MPKVKQKMASKNRGDMLQSHSEIWKYIDEFYKDNSRQQK